MQSEFLVVPNTEDEWKNVAKDFWDKWNFPFCLGAIDGKHVVMKAPTKSGSLYYNYKGTFSVVLMAVVDANLKFIYVDIGSYGHNSDGGVFSNCTLGKRLASESLNLPADAYLPNAQILGKVPYVFVADEAFPLQEHILRPFPGRNCQEQTRIFNYRLSRARRTVECAFGLLASRWRIYHTKQAMRVEVVEKVVQATCVLHNMLIQNGTIHNTDVADNETNGDRDGRLQNLPRRGNFAGLEAVHIREKYKTFFNEHNVLPWQVGYVNRGTF